MHVKKNKRLSLEPAARTLGTLISAFALWSFR